MHSTQGPAAHLLFEALAYAAGAQAWRRAARRQPMPPAVDRLFLLGCALTGAAAGSLLLHVSEHLPLWLAPHPDWRALVGKSALGGLVGGTLGVEAGKRLVGWRASTGDAWVPALALGLMIGRMGCQLSGTWDQTYGNPTALPWAWDYGDGVGRHPVAFYEIVLVALAWAFVALRVRGASGTRFAAFLCLYSLIRLGLDFLKPPFAPAAPGSLPATAWLGLSPIQWLALVAAPAYGRLWWRRRRTAAGAARLPGGCAAVAATGSAPPDEGPATVPAVPAAIEPR